MSISTPELCSEGAVLQCAGCRAVLGDSSDFVCALDCPGDGAKCLCLRGATEVHVDRIAHTTHAAGSSMSSAAGRSTYYAVCCAACGAAAGRLYTEAPPPLAPILHLFCLEAERCQYYELGSAQTRAAGAAGATPPPRQQQQRQQTGGGGGGDEGGELLERVEHLEAALLKLQGMLVLQDSQLRQLPHYQGDAFAADEYAAAAAGGSGGGRL